MREVRGRTCSAGANEVAPSSLKETLRRQLDEEVDARWKWYTMVG